MPIDPWSATERTGLPSPVSGEPHSVPAHDRLGPDDGYGVQGARNAAIKPNKQNPIGPAQIQSTWRAQSKHAQLMTQNHNFGFKPRSRLETVAQHAHQQQGNCDHQPQLCCDSSTATTLPDGVFGSDNRVESIVKRCDDLPYDADPGRMEFSERTGQAGKFDLYQTAPVPSRFDQAARHACLQCQITRRTSAAGRAGKSPTQRSMELMRTEGRGAHGLP